MAGMAFLPCTWSRVGRSDESNEIDVAPTEIRHEWMCAGSIPDPLHHDNVPPGCKTRADQAEFLMIMII